MEAIRLGQHKSAARVEVVYRDGTRAAAEVRDARGHQGNPLSRREVLDKFLGLAGGALGAARAEAVCATIIEGPAGMPLRDLFASLGEAV
jgi:2-methylcitrate dehydratase PrpD